MLPRPATLLSAGLLLLAALPGAALAQEPAAGATVLVRDFGERHRDRDWHRDRDRRHHGDWHDRGERSCGPREAVRKASRMGVRGAEIERVGRRGVTVSGWKRGDPILVRFAPVRGCPVVGYR